MYITIIYDASIFKTVALLLKNETIVLLFQMFLFCDQDSHFNRQESQTVGGRPKSGTLSRN